MRVLIRLLSGIAIRRMRCETESSYRFIQVQSLWRVTFKGTTMFHITVNFAGSLDLFFYEFFGKVSRANYPSP